MVHVLNHPLITHKLAIMRSKDTGTRDFRELLYEIAMLMTYEITRDLPTEKVEIETPICRMETEMIQGKKLAVVPILRAGLGMADGFLKIEPAAKVGHIGLYRDPDTKQPVLYYCKLPDDVSERLCVVTDPMLATGGSAADAISILKEKGVKNIKLMCLVGAPEGVELLQKLHPDVDVFLAALDECLNENKYIVPGLGDAGDRIFGTL